MILFILQYRNPWDLKKYKEYANIIIISLDYPEDSKAQTDMNVVMNKDEEFIEIQGTAEDNSFSQDQLQSMLKLAKKGIREILLQQSLILESYK